MKRQIFTLTVLSISLFSFAQENSKPQLQPLTKLDLGLQGVGVTFERRLGNSTTIDLSAGFGGGYDIWSNSFTYAVNIPGLAGYISITPKFYYNLEKRIAKGKPTDYNSGNYIGLRLKYATRSISEATNIRDALLFNIHWGLQRWIGKRWTMNTHFGAGYAVDATDLNNSGGTIYPALDLKFSYVLSKKK